MPTFKDNANRTWTVTLTGLGVKRIKDELRINIVDGFDLSSKAKRNVLQDIGDDPTILFDILEVLCRDQFSQHQVTGEQFAEALFGDALESATTALMEALCDFFPSLKRKILRTLMARMQDRKSSVTEEQIDQAVTLAVDRVMNPSCPSSTNSPDSVESTPTPEPCAS